MGVGLCRQPWYLEGSCGASAVVKLRLLGGSGGVSTAMEPRGNGASAAVKPQRWGSLAAEEPRGSSGAMQAVKGPRRLGFAGGDDASRQRWASAVEPKRRL